MAFSNLSSNSAVLAERSVGLISVFVGLSVVVLGGWILVYPMISQVLPGNELDRAMQEQVLSDRKAYRDGLTVLSGLMEADAKTTGISLTQVVPPTNDIPTLLASYEKIVKDQGAEASSISFSAPTETGAANKGASNERVTTSIKMTGLRYESLKNFFKEVERFQRISDVKSFGYDSEDGFATAVITNYFDK